jgi:hypothetical protein
MNIEKNAQVNFVGQENAATLFRSLESTLNITLQ